MQERVKKVLLLDDEPALLDKHADLFKLIPGYEVKTETNSIRAIDYVKNNPVDLLVFDVEMPGLNGLEMLPLLNPRPKLLMVTGYADYIVPGYLDDVDYCLTKPLLIPHLLKALHVIFKEETHSSKVLRPKLVITKTKRPIMNCYSVWMRCRSSRPQKMMLKFILSTAGCICSA